MALAVFIPISAAIVMALAFGAAHVENDSMQPTLHGGDLVVFDRFSAPARGDIVLFTDPDGWSAIDGATLVKRVIGVAGDTVVCCETGSGRLLVNGIALVEPYADESRPGGTIPFRVTVPAGTVWVMGDHRSASVDSRSAVNDAGRGAVALEAIRGVVRFFW